MIRGAGVSKGESPDPAVGAFYISPSLFRFRNKLYIPVDCSKVTKHCRGCNPGKEGVPYLEIITRHGHHRYFRHLGEAVIQELSNRYVGEWLCDDPVTRDAVAASEHRRSLILKHRNKVPYGAKPPEKVNAVFSQSDPPEEEVRRAFEDCKYL